MKKVLMAAVMTAVLGISAVSAGVQAANENAYVDAPKNVVEMQKTQAPGFFRMMVGNYEVTALFDGPGVLPTSLMEHHTDFTREELDEMIDYNRAPRVNGLMSGAINAFLVNTGDHLILVDSGKGEGVAPIYLDKEGRTVDSLKEAGYSPDQVDVILLTHLHSDHIGGIIKEGKRVFKNATLYIQEEDKAFWLDLPMDKMPEAAKPFAAIARCAAEPYMKAGKVKLYHSGDTLFGEVKTIPLFGHTAGHTGMEFTSKGESLLVWGDIMHNSAVQMDHPEVAIDFDSVDTEARATRLALLPKLVENKTIVAAAHFPFPGLGYVQKKTDGDGCYWIPVQYKPFNQH